MATLNLEQIKAWAATRRKPGLLTQTSYESTVLHHIDGLLAAIDELETENKELKLDLAAAEHYTTDDLTSPARFCVWALFFCALGFCLFAPIPVNVRVLAMILGSIGVVILVLIDLGQGQR